MKFKAIFYWQMAISGPGIQKIKIVDQDKKVHFDGTVSELIDFTLYIMGRYDANSCVPPKSRNKSSNRSKRNR